MEHRNDIWNKIDYSLVFIIFILFCISCYTLYVAQLNNLISGNYWKTQILMYIISFVFFLLALFIDLDIIEKLSNYFYFACILLLMGILILPKSIAPELNGAKGWYHFGPLSIQPAEFMKIALILVLSHLVVKSNNSFSLGNVREEFMLILKMALYLLPLVFFAKQFPDMGSLLVYVSIFVSIIFISKVRLRILLLLFSPFIVGLIFCILTYFLYPDFFFNTLLGSLPSYQADRFYGWLNPSRYTSSEGYQLQNALNTIGAGEFSGSRIGHSLVPYSYSDFIFTVIGGNNGFIGSSILILIYFVLIYKILKIGIAYQELYGRLVCFGILGMISYQVIQNIGMTIGLLPITGLSLPFISYGGSSLMINMFAVGLVLNIKVNTHEYMFK